MRQFIRNTFAATGLSLVLLAATATIYHATMLCLRTVFETLLVNLLIQLTLRLVAHLDLRYYYLEILLELSCITVLLLTAGAIFGWYSSTPAWVLALLGVLIYFIGGSLGILHVNRELAAINHELELRRVQM